MAKRRMMTMDIIDTDAFLDMPQTSQNLYFHLCMRADDDGFLGNPKKIMRILGSSADDISVLVSKRFVINFKSGVVVIKHWRMHNCIRKDRCTETTYLKEKELLIVKQNKSYTEKLGKKPVVEVMSTKCQPDVGIGKVRLGKVRLGKERKGKVILGSSKKDDPVNKIFTLFYKSINPGIVFGNKTNRKAVTWFIDKWGYDETERIIKQVIAVQEKGLEYCPTATTPNQVKEKLGNFKIFFDKLNNNQPKKRTII